MEDIYRETLERRGINLKVAEEQSRERKKERR